MRNLFKILPVLLFLILTAAIQAENIDECKSDLYFANGIMMKYSEQNASLIWIDKVDDLLMTKPEIQGKIANIKISYNISQGFLDDLIESFEQVMSNEWEWQIFTAFFTVYLTEHGIQEDWVPHIKDLTKQVKSYKESIKLGHGVVVIAHSQGNYYTNEAYELLDDWMKPYFKMMGVATPANHVAGFEAGDTTAPYVKFHNDFIKLVVTGLSSNRDDPNPNHNGTFSVAAHDFYESYLTAENTKGEILGFIETKVKEHTTAPSQWKTNEEFELNTCDYKITVKHRHDPDNITMDNVDTMVYPFNASKKLYQVNGEWVKASCGGENILADWDGQKDNECLMIDNPEEEKITQESCKDPSLFEVISQTNQNTSNWRVTVKNIETDEIKMDVYPFNLNGSLYQLESGEWVLASCGGTTIVDSWEGQQSNEYYMIDNAAQEKIASTTYVYSCRRYGEVWSYGDSQHYKVLSCLDSINHESIDLVRWEDTVYGDTPSMETMVSLASGYHDAMSFDMTDEYFTSKINEAKSLYGENSFTVQYDLSLSEKNCVPLPNQNRAYCVSYKAMYLIFN